MQKVKVIRANKVLLNVMLCMERGMDDLRLYILFNSISVRSGRWKGEHEG